MFSKLLKYDLRAILKYWWIAAVTSLAFGVIAGTSINMLNKFNSTASEMNIVFYSFPILGIVLSVIGIALFTVVTEVLILVRFYKHLFTDEGYLTFTLPVKKTQILNSKLLSACIFNAVTVAIVCIDVSIALIIGFGKSFFTADIWTALSATLKEALGFFGAGYMSVVVLEALLIFVLSAVASTLLVFVCITVAAAITRKHKVLAAIGIYYGVNAVTTGAIQIVMMPTNFYYLADRLLRLNEQAIRPSIVLALLMVLGMAVIVCSGLYLLEKYMLDKKLNLE